MLGFGGGWGYEAGIKENRKPADDVRRLRKPIARERRSWTRGTLESHDSITYPETERSKESARL